MTQVIFIQPSGQRQSCTAKPDDTVLDVALDNGIAGILGQCGGGCTCCTCHCWVSRPWLNLVNEPHRDELDMLEYAWGKNAQSRLACQIALHDGLDGIEVLIPEQQA